MPNIPPFRPDAKSCLLKSEKSADLLEIFAHGIQDISEDKVDEDYVIQQLLDTDPSLKEKKVTKEIHDAVKKFRSLTCLKTGISPEEINSILSDETKRAENIAGIRRGVAGVFLTMIKNVLNDPQQLLEMDPRAASDWYKIVRTEEDRERELMLLAKAEAREDAKFRLMFFDFVSGQLGPEDIEFLNADLKADLALMLNANQDRSSRRVLEGAAVASPGTGAQ